MPDRSAVSRLLLLGFRHLITEPNVEAAFGQIAALADGPLDPAQFHAAVAEALARGLIAEPIRLPEGSLHCHWRLELTPKGVAAARALIAKD